MLNITQFIRLFKINTVLARYALNRSVLSAQPAGVRWLSYLNPYSFREHGKSRGESIRRGLESLGPIFVKFGQLLSTRDNLFPDDIIDELSKLQDRVPPFASEQAVALIEKSLGAKVNVLFRHFDATPLASASVAQVHAAELHDGTQVVVKVVRPHIHKLIKHDIALMFAAASIGERVWSQGKRLRLKALVREFEQTITDELDLSREAANASLLRRNFDKSPIMYVPKVFWDYTTQNVMVIERVSGINISDVDTLLARKTNMKKLAERGVEIFFTQVFRDSFFHADMHPGNLFVDISDPQDPKYVGVDFGIMGSLNPCDQQYLAANMLAFFNREYRKIAELHIESGWVPPDTRLEQFEAAIRTVCEPIFEKPLGEISFGKLLMRLFQTAERFNMPIQPQLMLLQKTLINIEALGRRLYPELNLWLTAKPFLQRWVSEQRGARHLLKELTQDMPLAIEKVMMAPLLLHDVLQETERRQREARYQSRESVTKRSRKASILIGGAIGIAASSLPGVAQLPTWSLLGVSAAMLLLAWVLPKKRVLK